MAEQINHIGIVMDGNRRFSKRLMKEPWKGHEFGANKVKDVINWCIEKEMKMLTLYTFSHENFNRPKKEFDFLMKLFSKEFDELINDSKELVKQGIKINFIGRTEMFSDEIQNKMKKIMDMTSKHDRFVVNFAMAYSGRVEIVDAVKKIIRQGLSEDEVNEKIIFDNLYLASEPELIIRTGGEKRMSNFLTFQSVYTELFFIDSLWPEFTHQEFKDVVERFSKRERRFGR